MNPYILKVFQKLTQRLKHQATSISTKDCRAACGYLNAKETVEAATNAQMSVCDYVEAIWDKRGCTAAVIEHMERHGVFTSNLEHIVEIGAGTGRYMDKVLRRCSPVVYESYETAEDWSEWLQLNYPIHSISCDGKTLSQTASATADLVHAHGVFVYTPFLITMGYCQEMIRIAAERSTIVFDIFSETCFDETTLRAWLASNESYPSFLSKNFLASYFEQKDFKLAGCFLNEYGFGRSEYLVFKR